jgi:class 3 adenylate cyclase
VVGTNEGGLAALLFAALHPERTAALVLFQAYARLAQADDYRIGWAAETVERLVSDATAPPADEGRPFDLLAGLAPSVAEDEAFRRWWERAGRQGASPATAKALWSAYAMADVRAVLPMIQAPTLVVVRPDDAALSPAFGRFLADHIPGARLVELPGPDNLWWVDAEAAFTAEVEEFLTGVRPAPPTQRVLATVLFTDVISSTTVVSEIGDRRWRELIGRHCAEADDEVRRNGGRLVKTTGHGILATFDGPGRAIRCAQRISRSAEELGIHVRAPLHTGEVEVMGEDVGGIAVHIAARVMAYASAGEVLVSSSIPPLVVGSGIQFDDRGEPELKGVPGSWRLFATVE